MLKFFAIRGATTVEKNSIEDITKSSVDLIKKICIENNLTNDNVVSIMCSTTTDITAFYPVRAIRESGIIDAPLFSMIEPEIENALPLCIRIMIHVNKEYDFKAKHIYLNGASNLRKDLIK